MKKLLAILLSLVMLASLAACGQEAPAETTPATAAPTEAATAEAAPTEAAGPQKNTDIYPLDCDTVFDIVSGWVPDSNDLPNAKILEEATGVHVNHMYWEDEQQSIALASKELPDAFFLRWGLTKSDCQEYGDAGYFVDFTDYWDLMPNFRALCEEYPEILDVCANEDGSIYCLPKVGRGCGGENNVIYCRTDLLREAGWDHIPATTDELLQCMLDMQAFYGPQDPEFIAFNPTTFSHMEYDGRRLVGFLFPAFGDLVTTKLAVDDNGQVVFGAASEQFKDLLAYLNAFYESGAFPKDVYTMDLGVGRAIIAGEHCVFSTLGGYDDAKIADGTIELELMAPLTSDKNPNQVFWGSPVANFDSLNIITSACEEPEVLVRWFDAMYSTREDPLNEEGTVWGICTFLGEEGVTFELHDDTKTYNWLPLEGKELGEGYGFEDCLGNGVDGVDMSYVANPNTAFGRKCVGTVEKLWPHAVSPFDPTILALTSDQKDLYNDCWADIDMYIDEMSAKFVTGEISVEDGWQEYVDTLNSMGLPDVLAMYQEVYDAK